MHQILGNMGQPHQDDEAVVLLLVVGVDVDVGVVEQVGEVLIVEGKGLDDRLASFQTTRKFE